MVADLPCQPVAGQPVLTCRVFVSKPNTRIMMTDTQPVKHLFSASLVTGTASKSSTCIFLYQALPAADTQRAFVIAPRTAHKGRSSPGRGYSMGHSKLAVSCL